MIILRDVDAASLSSLFAGWWASRLIFQVRSLPTTVCLFMAMSMSKGDLGYSAMSSNPFYGSSKQM